MARTARVLAVPTPRYEAPWSEHTGAPSWPDGLKSWLKLWFVIDKEPEVPQGGQCRFVKAIGRLQGHLSLASGDPRASRTGHGVSSGRCPASHVRQCYASNLAVCGIPTPDGWLEYFRRFFAFNRAPGDTVLLFPGAGHPAKQWPLVQFILLAGMLRQQGFDPVCVVGPAELERGLAPQGMSVAAPGSLEDLEELLLKARAVVGGDTGPMHLAGMLGVPGVSPLRTHQLRPMGPGGHAGGKPCAALLSPAPAPARTWSVGIHTAWGR